MKHSSFDVLQTGCSVGKDNNCLDLLVKRAVLVLDSLRVVVNDLFHVLCGQVNLDKLGGLARDGRQLIQNVVDDGRDAKPTDVPRYQLTHGTDAKRCSRKERHLVNAGGSEGHRATSCVDGLERAC
jgi:hypothetical protein